MGRGVEPVDVQVKYSRGGRDITDQARPVERRNGDVLYHLDMSDRDVLVPTGTAQNAEHASKYIENELESESGFDLDGIPGL